MCDYSLYAVPNRLAEDGETVVLHKFGTGTIGFASVMDVPPKQIAKATGWKGFCVGFKSLFTPRSCPVVPAVCMPPGTRLMITEMPSESSRRLWLRPGDSAIVTEITSQSYSYRDALILPNGRCVLLQELPEGMKAMVVSTGVETPEIGMPSEVYAS